MRKRIVQSSLTDESTNLERLLAEIPEGREICVSYARQISLLDESATAYRDLIRDFDNDKTQDLGVLCNKHKIPHADFLARVVKEAYPVADEALNLSKMISTGIVASRLPKVVERGLIEAAKSDGVADRHFTLQKEGFHVAPKGMSISMTQVAQQAAGLSSFEEHTRGIADILAGGADEDHLLESGETDYIDVEEEVKEEQLA